MLLLGRRLQALLRPCRASALQTACKVGLIIKSWVCRPLKRKDASCDEDYVQPLRCYTRSQAAPSYGLRTASAKRNLTLSSTALKFEEDSLCSEPEDEANLEQGAVEGDHLRTVGHRME